MQLSNRYAVSEPLSARPASVLRTLANPLCKGSCRRKPTEGLFFYNPSTTSWSPSPYTGEAHSNPSRRRLQACSAYLQIPPTAARFPNPSRRRLQACFAHSQIPLHKGAFFNQSRLCRTASLRFSLLSLLSAQRFVPRRKCVKKFYKKRKIYGNKSEYMI